jgi:hypothetical protein
MLSFNLRLAIIFVYVDISDCVNVIEFADQLVIILKLSTLDNGYILRGLTFCVLVSAELDIKYPKSGLVVSGALQQ